MTRGQARKMFSRSILILISGLLFAAATASGAQAPNRLLSVAMEEGAAAPTVLIRTAEAFDYRYTVYDSVNPVRIVVDFPGMETGGTAGTLPLRSAPLKEIQVNRFELASGSLARVEIILDAHTEYKIKTQDRDFRIVFSGLSTAARPSAAPVKTAPVASQPRSVAGEDVVSGRQVVVESLDFINREGRSYVVARLSAPAKISQPVQDGNLVRFEIRNATISRSLRRPVDASAFPSAVKSINPYVVNDDGRPAVRIAVDLKAAMPFALASEGNDVVLAIDDGTFAEPLAPAVTTREVAVEGMPSGKPAPAIDASSGWQTGEMAAPRYTGQKISLIFDGADIRSILQLIGDVSGYNILAGPDVTGEITLRLIDVPWDQALRLVLNTMHLKSITEGNVVQIYTAKGFAEAKKLELETRIAESKAADEINTRKVIQINYVNMDSIQNLAMAYGDNVKLNLDKNTKKVILSGKISAVDALEAAILEIDRPERQVLIEARIVESNTDYSRELGVNWESTYNNDANSGGTDSVSNANLGLGGDFLVTRDRNRGTFTGSVLGMTFGKIGVDSLIIDAKLSALESQGNIKILSTPKVTTLNGGEAKIESGREIAYTTTSQNGTNTEWKKANLTLTVTPEINPNDTLILSLLVENNNPSSPINGQTSIENKSAKTKVILKSGETTVIGGVFIESEDESDVGVPYLKDIPYLGQLFKAKHVKKARRELLILVTPRVLSLES